MNIDLLKLKNKGEFVCINSTLYLVNLCVTYNPALIGFQFLRQMKPFNDFLISWNTCPLFVQNIYQRSWQVHPTFSYIIIVFQWHGTTFLVETELANLSRFYIIIEEKSVWKNLFYIITKEKSTFVVLLQRKNQSKKDFPWGSGVVEKM